MSLIRAVLIHEEACEDCKLHERPSGRIVKRLSERDRTTLHTLYDDVTADVFGAEYEEHRRRVLERLPVCPGCLGTGVRRLPELLAGARRRAEDLAAYVERLESRCDELENEIQGVLDEGDDDRERRRDLEGWQNAAEWLQAWVLDVDRGLLDFDVLVRRVNELQRWGPMHMQESGNLIGVQ